MSSTLPPRYTSAKTSSPKITTVKRRVFHTPKTPDEISKESREKRAYDSGKNEIEDLMPPDSRHFDI
jgi:hypothetical protein